MSAPLQSEAFVVLEHTHSQTTSNGSASAGVDAHARACLHRYISVCIHPSQVAPYTLLATKM